MSDQQYILHEKTKLFKWRRGLAYAMHMHIDWSTLGESVALWPNIKRVINQGQLGVVSGN